MTPNIPTPSPAEQRDLAALDAHTALRSALLPLILRRPDAEAIMARVTSGTELQIDYSPSARIFAASLVGSDLRCILSGSLADEAPAADLTDVLGIALAAALNHEAPERRQAIAAAVQAGADFVCRLRVLGSVEALTLALVLGDRIVWQATRATPFDAADCLMRPTMH
jgi:hypothetical protein